MSVASSSEDSDDSSLSLVGANGSFLFLNCKHSCRKEFIEYQNDKNNVKIMFCKK